MTQKQGLILFHTEAPLIFELEHQDKVEAWLRSVITTEKHDLNLINYIFCTDEYIYQINMDYLQHDTYTDIITFDNSEEENELESDIFISIERIKENAQNLNIAFYTELHRVLVHGILHLVGYKDKTPTEAQKMREMEDFHLASIPVL